jgi:hypothetical protein
VVGPPAAPAVVALTAIGPVPHLDEVRITRGDAAPDRRFDAVDRVVHGGEQHRPTVPKKMPTGPDKPAPFAIPPASGCSSTPPTFTDQSTAATPR